VIYKYLKFRSQTDGAGLFSAVCCNKTGGHEEKNCNTKLHTNMKNNFFTLRVTEHRNNQCREVVESPSPDIFKIH